jgi:hypothetical protein
MTSKYHSINVDLDVTPESEFTHTIYTYIYYFIHPHHPSASFFKFYIPGTSLTSEINFSADWRE